MVRDSSLHPWDFKLTHYWLMHIIVPDAAQPYNRWVPSTLVILMADRETDLLIIGAGIVGLATALEATRRFPRMRIVVVDKENRVAAHQTGHNSGVIHSGLYYKTGSLKARNCVAGAASMKRFCREHGIPYEECGKLVVATSDDEVPRLEALHERGNANGVPGLRMLPREEIREFEPHCVGLRALHVPSTGIVDYA